MIDLVVMSTLPVKSLIGVKMLLQASGCAAYWFSITFMQVLFEWTDSVSDNYTLFS